MKLLIEIKKKDNITKKFKLGIKICLQFFQPLIKTRNQLSKKFKKLIHNNKKEFRLYLFHLKVIRRLFYKFNITYKHFN